MMPRYFARSPVSIFSATQVMTTPPLPGRSQPVDARQAEGGDMVGQQVDVELAERIVADQGGDDRPGKAVVQALADDAEPDQRAARIRRARRQQLAQDRLQGQE